MNERLSFPLMDDYKEYGIDEILNSKLTWRKGMFPSQMERVIS